MLSQSLLFQAAITFALLVAPACPTFAADNNFVEEFNGKQFDKNVWETSGDRSSLFTVRDGTLRLIAQGEQHEANMTTRRGDFNFFKSPIVVVWDLDAEHTLAGPYAPTAWGRIYAGVAIGGADLESPAAELGLSAWPEKYPRPKADALWYYTLNLGQLTPGDPGVGWRLDGIPTRITWSLDATRWTVTVTGAKFAAGDPHSRTGEHRLNAGDFAPDGFHLKLFACPMNKSIEVNANHISSVVYTDAIRMMPSERLAEFEKQTPAAAPSPDARIRPVQGIQLASEELPGFPQYLFGVNYCGNEFRDPKKFDVPDIASLDYFARKGVLFIRQPFSWERIQPKLFGPLDEQVLANLKQTVKLMGERRMKVMLDMHNYARYRGKLIGTDDVPLTAFTDVWKRLAAEFKDEPAIWGLELMNEPHNTNNTWPVIAQAGIDGIRAVDGKTMIVIDADGWSSTIFWVQNGGNLHKVLKDPSDNLCFDGHCYFDWNASGIYANSYEYDVNKPNAENVHPMIGVKRIKPFVDWLKANNLKGVIGELGTPANADRDPRWLEVMDNVYDYLGRNGIPSTYWSAGTQWHKNMVYIIEPENGHDRPQMQILLKYASKYAARATNVDATSTR